MSPGEADRIKLQAVLDLVVKSETGRELLTEAQKHGYKIMLEDLTGGYGFVDCVKNKIIVLNRNFPAEGIALTLAHELAHVRQKETGGIETHMGAYRMDEAVRVMFAREADAFAHSVQLALELKKQGIDGPYQELYKRNSFVAHVSMLMAHEKPEMLDNGAIMAFAFETFYLHDPRRVTYAKLLVKTVAADVHRQEVKTGTRKLALGKAFNAAVLKGKFRHKGKSYLDEHLPELDLEAPHYSGIPARLRDAVNIIYERAEGLTEADKKALENMPAYRADPAGMGPLLEKFQKRYGLGG